MKGSGPWRDSSRPPEALAHPLVGGRPGWVIDRQIRHAEKAGV